MSDALKKELETLKKENESFKKENGALKTLAEEYSRYSHPAKPRPAVRKTLLIYKGKAFNIKSKVFQSQEDVNKSFFSPTAAKKLVGSGHLEYTPEYKKAVAEGEDQSEKAKKAQAKK